MNAPDLSAVGTALGTLLAAAVVGVAGFIGGRGKRNKEAAALGAETDVIKLMRAEVERLSERVKQLEAARDSDRKRIFDLERTLIQAGLPLPPVSHP